ncbi:hypothetical protein PVOR_13549 [Paenibacillus vortex V453]|uniref:Uncharacterized protein n=1 Tax=Paenibacillus vortex V453 TaxID=715225 RepID=A0A2R9SVL2_9BACL|nr:hypothetical protein PVOR_13549 [Paenibacillus vortex V453]
MSGNILVKALDLYYNEQKMFTEFSGLTLKSLKGEKHHEFTFFNCWGNTWSSADNYNRRATEQFGA